MSTRRLVFAALLALAAGCAPESLPARCGRIDAPSMGPENGFRVVIAAGTRTAGALSRIDVAVVAAVPLDAPVVLVHSREGRELARWTLTMPPAEGIVRRCSIGAADGNGGCGAGLGSVSSVEGEWRIEAGASRLAEAQVAFRDCAATE